MKFITTLFVLFLATHFAFAQNNTVQFGKNRVQYHQRFDEWMQYESDNFITYWYGNGKNIGQLASQMAEYDFNELLKILKYPINMKVQIIVYQDITDIKQSNIGSEDVFTNVTGNTKILGDKIFVYFNGDHNHFRKQLREGITSVYLESMLLGASFQEKIQNAVSLNLPKWCKQGFSAYIGYSWSAQEDDLLRNELLNPEYKNFVTLAEEQPRLAGQAFWYFIAYKYGEDRLSDVLYLTRINRGLEEGIYSVLGISLDRLLIDWQHYFDARYKFDQDERNLPAQVLEIKNKRNLPITQLTISPDGRRIAYVVNEIGRYKVKIFDKLENKEKTVFKHGFKNAFQATDYDYPLLDWNPNGQELAIVYEKRDIIQFRTYNIVEKKSTEVPLNPSFDRVYNLDYINPFKLVFSGAAQGYSDIFIYHTKTRQSQRITHDFYDDLDPVFVRLEGRDGILFSSNRQGNKLQQLRADTILPIDNFDLFYYDIQKQNKELVRITNTPLYNETSPKAIDEKWFAYLSDENGIVDRKTGYLEDYIDHYEQVIYINDGSEIVLHADSSLTMLDTTVIDSIAIFPVIKKRGIVHNNSNYTHNINLYDIAMLNNTTVQLLQDKSKYKIYIDQLSPQDTIIAPVTQLYKKLYKNKTVTTIPPKVETPIAVTPPTKPKQIKVEKPKEEEEEIDIDNYLFQTGFEEEEEEVTTPQNEITTITIDEGKEETTVVVDKPTAKPSKQIALPPTVTFNGVQRFRPGKVVPYRTRFHTEYTRTYLDNSLLFDGLESYTGNSGTFSNQLGILMKMKIKDLLEDYELDMGVRIPTDFRGTEYFIVFQDKKKRLDKSYAVYRKNDIQTIAFNNNANAFYQKEYNILLAQYQLSYPLDIFRAFKGTFTARRDRSLIRPLDVPSLEAEVLTEARVGAKLEYIFDNTLDVGINIKHGTRYKAYIESVKRINVDANTGEKIGLADGFTTIVGYDFRHYQKLDKRSILALRSAGATSFGSESLLYYMGGTDGQLFNLELNNSIPIPDGTYAYQTLATNLRGFDRNVRNGNSYILANAELRVPLFQYISRRIRSSFLRNFQVVGFFDVGTAWAGSSPLSDENPLNISYFPDDNPDPKVLIKVKYFRDPIVYGYGVGARAVLFGHYFRIDYAWGVETGTTLDPRIHISMGTDF